MLCKYIFSSLPYNMFVSAFHRRGPVRYKFQALFELDSLAVVNVRDVECKFYTVVHFTTFNAAFLPPTDAIQYVSLFLRYIC